MPIQSCRVSAIERIVADIRVSVKRLRVFRMTGLRIGRQNLPVLDELYLASKLSRPDSESRSLPVNLWVVPLAPAICSPKSR